jgi:hypothetical protein
MQVLQKLPSPQINGSHPDQIQNQRPMASDISLQGPQELLERTYRGPGKLPFDDKNSGPSLLCLRQAEHSDWEPLVWHFALGGPREKTEAILLSYLFSAD